MVIAQLLELCDTDLFLVLLDKFSVYGTMW